LQQFDATEQDVPDASIAPELRVPEDDEPVGPSPAARAFRAAVGILLVAALLAYFIIPIRTISTRALLKAQEAIGRILPAPLAPKPEKHRTLGT
jgi:hypothetical protein